MPNISPETWNVIYVIIALALGYWLKSKGISIPNFPPVPVPPAEALREIGPPAEAETVRVPVRVLESMMDRMVKEKVKK